MKKLRVLVACEYSGIVRQAFSNVGWDAWSCDFLPTEIPGQHIEGDVIPYLTNQHWDLLVGHPTCTYMCNSGAKHLYLGMKKENGRNEERWAQMQNGVNFFRKLWHAPIEHICLENPIMLGYAQKLIGDPPSQTIQPFEHGEPFQKATCLWLKNLPLIRPTNIVKERKQACWLESPGPDRWKNRSRTYPGIAKALADQFTQHFI